MHINLYKAGPQLKIKRKQNTQHLPIPSMSLLHLRYIYMAFDLLSCSSAKVAEKGNFSHCFIETVA